MCVPECPSLYNVHARVHAEQKRCPLKLGLVMNFCVGAGNRTGSFANAVSALTY